VGLKPTFDEVAIAGVVPLGISLDHVGPIARSVDDAAIVFDALCGRPGAVSDDEEDGHPDLHGLKFARLRGYFEQRLDPGVRLAYRQAVDALVRAGAQVYDVQLGYAAEIAPVYLATVLAEAAAYHADTLASHPEAYTSNVRIRLEMCRYILGEDYVRAQQGRAVFRREVDQVIEQIGPVILPTVPIPAQVIGTSTVEIDGKPDSVRNLTLRLTQLFNLTGHPAITLPCGTADEMPVGLQVVGARHRTRALIEVARRIEPVVGG
jgi:aspartyl-tRNA(Asn)/glutamyl-tRNA(Gln) amidotransferase subunit A